MFSRWFSSTRLPPKLSYSPSGELDIMNCSGMDRLMRVVFFGGVGYMYMVYRISPESPMGKLRKYVLPVCGALLTWQVFRFSKYLMRMCVVEGGEHVRLEKYPLFGFGHPKKLMVPVSDFEGLYPMGEKTWYNPFGWFKGYYRLRFSRYVLGQSYKDYVIFRIPKNYNKDALKLLLLGKPITDKSLRQLESLKSRKFVKVRN